MKTQFKQAILWFILSVIGLFISLQYFQKEHHKVLQNKEYSSPQKLAQENNHNQSIPLHAIETWQYIKKNHRAPLGFEGGRVFQNREKRLPTLKGKELKSVYFEWDVKPKIKGQNRGPERLVSRSFEKAWYTSDHYQTFTEIKE